MLFSADLSGVPGSVHLFPIRLTTIILVLIGGCSVNVKVVLPAVILNSAGSVVSASGLSKLVAGLNELTEFLRNLLPPTNN